MQYQVTSFRAAMYDRYVPVLTVMTVVLVSGSGQESNGEWSPWSEWSHCSRTCGPGTLSRTSTWIEAEGEPKFDQPFTMTQNWDCNDNQPCPVDGHWGIWNAWSLCSAACGGGDRQRKRFCSKPANGGVNCEGEDFEEEDCNIVSCPPRPKNFNMSSCTAQHFTCTSKQMCIPIGELCDDTVQCHDGSDETRCYDVKAGLGSVYSHVKDSAHGLGPITIFGYLALTTANCNIFG